MPADVVLRTDGLTKRFGRLTALDQLTVEAYAGEVFGFLGPNGAGKTTTIRLLLGLLRPTAGHAELLGYDIRDPEARRNIGYLPGDLALYSRMTGTELLDYLARLRGGVRRERIDELVGRLAVDPGRRIGELSRGNRQKLGLVQALMHEPGILLLDEPTSGLDPLVQREFRALVREATAAGALVFLSSHDLDDVQRMADRAAVLNAGRLVAVEDVTALAHRAARQVEVVFADAVPQRVLAGLPGVTDVVIDGRVLQCTVAGSPTALLGRLARHRIASLTSHEPDLESVFLRDYSEARDAS